MNIVDLPAADKGASAQFVTPGLLHSFAKSDANAPESFHALLPSDADSAASKSGKLTAANALLSRGRGVQHDGEAPTSKQASGPDAPSSSHNTLGDDSQPPTSGADFAPKESKSADNASGGVTESRRASSDRGVDELDSSAGLSPEDAALDAAAFAAAALLAKNAATQEGAAEGVDSAAGQADQPVDVVSDQVSLRVFQAAGRFGLTTGLLAEAQGTQDEKQVPVAEQSPETLTNAASKALASLQGQNVNSTADGQEAGSSDASNKGRTVAAPSAGLSATQASVGELSQKLREVATKPNAVADALAAYTKGTEVLSDKAVRTFSELDPSGTESVQSVSEGVATPAATPDGQASDALTPEGNVGAQSATVKSNAQGQDASAFGNASQEKQSGDSAQRNPSSKTALSAAAVSVTVSSKVTVPVESTPSSASALSAQKENAAARGKGASEVSAVPSSEVQSSALHESHLSDGKTVGAESGAVSQSATQMHGTAEASQKPVQEGVRHVQNNVELWRTVNDAVQRVRSENPSHLAMELRLRDGTAISLELRMGAAGIEASFKADSQGLLKALETQWSAFLERQPSDVRVASTVFEGRTGPDLSGNGGNSGERREMFEDSAASASLASSSDSFSLELPSEEALSSSSIPLSVPARLNLYA